MNHQPARLTPRRAAMACLVAALTTLGCRGSASTPAADPGSSSAQAGTTRSAWNGTQRVAVNDPQFGITAVTLEIPGGWKFAGQIVSAPGCHGVANAVDFTAQAQDGITAIVELPGVRWTVTPGNNRISQMNARQCRPINLTSASQFLVNIAVPNMHPGAKIEAVLPLKPEAQAAVTRQLEQMRQQNASLGPLLRASDQTLDGARARVQYVRDGHPVEEELTVLLACTQTPQMGKTCTTRGTSVVRAPKGQLDAVLAQPTIQNIVRSLKGNPEWSQRLNQQAMDQFHASQVANNEVYQNFERNNQAQFEQQIANDRAQDAQRARSTASAISADRARMNAIDQSAHNTVNYSLDRRDYVNPATGETITASSEYNHQWINSSNDTLVQTNDPNFDPNGSIDPVRESWTELVPK